MTASPPPRTWVDRIGEMLILASGLFLIFAFGFRHAWRVAAFVAFIGFGIAAFAAFLLIAAETLWIRWFRR